jgi:hypothetical protein
MSKEMDLYVVDLPRDLDYKGIIRTSYAGTVEAKSEKHAVRGFILRKKSQKKFEVYEDLKKHMGDKIEQLAQTATHYIAYYYAVKYMSGLFDERLDWILSKMGVDRIELVDLDELVGFLDDYYMKKYGKDFDKLRIIYGTIKKQMHKAYEAEEVKRNAGVEESLLFDIV